MKKISLELGQKLYRSAGSEGIFTYEVVGVKMDYGKILYELKCESCKGHEPCHLYVTENDDGTYIYFDMINNDWYEHWHNGKDPYYTERREAEIFYIKRLIDYYENEIIKLEKSIEDKKEKIKELKEEIKQLEVKK